LKPQVRLSEGGSPGQQPSQLIGAATRKKVNYNENLRAGVDIENGEGTTLREAECRVASDHCEHGVKMLFAVLGPKLFSFFFKFKSV